MKATNDELPTEDQLDREAVYKFSILHKGWELDNKGWIMQDGRIFTTSHTSVYEMSAAELERKIVETQRSLDGLRYALISTRMP